MGDHQHRHAGGRELAHHAKHLTDEFRVQCRRRLVEQHQLGVHRQRTGDGHALLLAAGQLGRIGIGLARQPDPVEQIAGPFQRLGLALAFDPDGRLDHVLQGGAVWEQVEVLKHHADVAALFGRVLGTHLVQLAVPLAVADEIAVDIQPARVDYLQVVDAPQEGGFARARRPDQAHHLTALDLQRDALEHLERPEVLAHLVGEHHRLFGLGHAGSPAWVCASSTCAAASALSWRAVNCLLAPFA